MENEKKKTLKEIGKETGITKQAVWLKTERGIKYRRRYEKRYYKKNRKKMIDKQLGYYHRRKITKSIIIKK